LNYLEQIAERSDRQDTLRFDLFAATGKRQNEVAIVPPRNAQELPIGSDRAALDNRIHGWISDSQRFIVDIRESAVNRRGSSMHTPAESPEANHSDY